MTETRPNMVPGWNPELTAMQGRGMAVPSAGPPASVGSLTSKGDCGCSGNASGGVPNPGSIMPGLADMGFAAPSLLPAGGVGGGVTAWQQNKRITGLWSINQNRNSWVHIDGIGWKKLANNSDSAIVTLTMLSAHAREKASVVNYREESDGMIREIYVW